MSTSLLWFLISSLLINSKMSHIPYDVTESLDEAEPMIGGVNPLFRDGGSAVATLNDLSSISQEFQGLYTCVSVRVLKLYVLISRQTDTNCKRWVMHGATTVRHETKYFLRKC